MTKDILKIMATKEEQEKFLNQLSKVIKNLPENYEEMVCVLFYILQELEIEMKLNVIESYLQTKLINKKLIDSLKKKKE